MNRSYALSLQQQRGAVLLVSLMILLIMTVLGIAGMSSTTMEEKMAANNQQRQQAYQAAETALRDAEAWLTNNVTAIGDLANFSGANGLYSLQETASGAAVNPPTFNLYDNSAWQSNGVASLSLLDNQDTPRYIIEYMGPTEDPAGLNPNDPVPVVMYAFRITAIGWSVDGTSRYLAWSHYTRRLN
ncbi:MAG: hypothetical protein HZB57_09920 [Gammaproteobacteria bacterium]|nr:hypothetical protein [Gammaproteobacteria bacterium]